VVTALETARSEIAAIVGEKYVATDEQARAALSVDDKTPQMVVYPSSAEQVAATLRYASERGLAVIPCRNGTKLAIGNPPRKYDIALSLKNLNRVWHYEPADLTVSVEPGMKFGDFQRFVGRRKLWLPLNPAGGEQASLGGIVATHAAGSYRRHYGTPRDMVLGMKIATTEGKVVKTGGRVVKNVAGYDLAKLLIGSYGTLGVIVEISFKLFPLPLERATFVLSLDSLDSASEFRRRILRSPLDPLQTVLLNRPARELVDADAPGDRDGKEYEIWTEAGGSKRVVERYARSLEEMSRTVGAKMAALQAERADRSWRRLADLGALAAEKYPQAVVMKASLPISAGEDFIGRAQQAAAGLRVITVAQIGVGIVCVCLLDGQSDPKTADLAEKLRQAAETLGGALVVERCPAELKRRLNVWSNVGDGFDAMRKLKETWDPKGILSPGRFAGGL
jgi:glycolate dehydrogenase FAD-binding subunit